MRQRLINIFRTSTVRQSAVTIFSTFTSAGLGAIFYTVVARILHPSGNGIFTLGLTIFTLGTTVCDLGMGQSLVRFIGENRHPPAYFPFAKIAFRTKLATGLAFFLLVTIFSHFLAYTVLHQPAVASILPVVGLTVFFQLFFSYATAVSQGLQKFFVWGGIQVGGNLFRLLLLFLLTAFSLTTPSSAMLLVGLASFFGFVFAWFNFDRGILSSKISAEDNHRFWNFNKWTAAFIIISSLVSRLDTLLTGRLLTLTDTGVYGFSSLMVSFLPQLATAIGAVTSAKFAGITEHQHATSYLRKAVLLNVVISVLVALVMVPTALIFISFTGAGYNQSLTPFIILLSSLVIFMSGNPLRDSILYYFRRPQFFVFSGIGQGIVLITLGLALIPRFGIVGSSLSVLGGHIFLATICVIYYLRLSRLHEAKV